MLGRETLLERGGQSPQISSDPSAHALGVPAILDPLGVGMAVAKTLYVVLLGVHDELRHDLRRCRRSRGQILVSYIRVDVVAEGGALRPFNNCEQLAQAAGGIWIIRVGTHEIV